MQRKSATPFSLFLDRASAAPQLPARALWTLLVLMLLVAASGCPASPPAAGPAASRESPPITVACPAELPAAVIRRYSGGWASRSGRRVEVLRYDRQTGPQQTTATVWVVHPAEMPRWAAAAMLEPVPDTLIRGNNYAWRDLLPQLPAYLLTWDRQVYAVPLLGEGQVCLYREDWLSDPENRQAFRDRFGRDLTPPGSWEEVAEIAEFFRDRPAAEHPSARPSLPALPASDDDLDREIFSVLAPFAQVAQPERPGRQRDIDFFSFHYDLQTGQPRIAGPGFVAGLQLLQRLQACRWPGSSAEPVTQFRDGKAVLCLADPRWAARLQEKDSPVRNKFGILPVPGTRQIYAGPQPLPAEDGLNSVPYLGSGGWLAVVRRGAADAEAAFDLLAYLSGPAVSMEILVEPSFGGGPIRREHVQRPEDWRSFGLGPDRSKALVDALRKTQLPSHLVNPVLRLRIPDERNYQQAFLAEVRKALLEGADARQSLERVANQWRELDAGKDFKTRLADYRKSLGF